jgi:hypothetical protein
MAAQGGAFAPIAQTRALAQFPTDHSRTDNNKHLHSGARDDCSSYNYYNGKDDSGLDRTLAAAPGGAALVVGGEMIYNNWNGADGNGGGEGEDLDEGGDILDWDPSMEGHIMDDDENDGNAYLLTADGGDGWEGVDMYSGGERYDGQEPIEEWHPDMEGQIN